MSDRCLIDYRSNVTKDDIQRFDIIFDEDSTVETLVQWGPGPHKLLVRAPELIDRFKIEFLKLWDYEYFTLLYGE
jgi:hypothetical protein